MTLRIALLSNFTIDSLAGKLKTEGALFHPPGFGLWFEPLLNPKHDLFECGPQIIFVILDGFALFQKHACESLDSREKAITTYFQGVVDSAIQHPEILFFVSNLDLPSMVPQSFKEIIIFFFEKC